MSARLRAQAAASPSPTVAASANPGSCRRPRPVRSPAPRPRSARPDPHVHTHDRTVAATVRPHHQYPPHQNTLPRHFRNRVRACAHTQHFKTRARAHTRTHTHTGTALCVALEGGVEVGLPATPTSPPSHSLLALSLPPSHSPRTPLPDTTRPPRPLRTEGPHRGGPEEGLQLVPAERRRGGMGWGGVGDVGRGSIDYNSRLFRRRGGGGVGGRWELCRSLSLSLLTQTRKRTPMRAPPFRFPSRRRFPSRVSAPFSPTPAAPLTWRGPARTWPARKKIYAFLV